MWMVTIVSFQLVAVMPFKNPTSFPNTTSSLKITSCIFTGAWAERLIQIRVSIRPELCSVHVPFLWKVRRPLLHLCNGTKQNTVLSIILRGVTLWTMHSCLLQPGALPFEPNIYSSAELADQLRLGDQSYRDYIISERFQRREYGIWRVEIILQKNKKAKKKGKWH